MMPFSNFTPIFMNRFIKNVLPASVIYIGSRISRLITERYCLLKYGPFTLREGTTDINVFRNVFLFGELNLPVTISPRLIIDGGAYTGLTSLYYAKKYPAAKIIAVEPEPSNYQLLVQHTKRCPNVETVNAALWHQDAYLKIIDRGTGKWGFKVEEVGQTDDYDARGVTIDSLLKHSGFDQIDILKLDIEGSEWQLFSNNYELWIHKVGIVVIELHDRINAGCTHAVMSALDSDQWHKYQEGEKVIFVRRALANAAVSDLPTVNL